MAEIIRAFGEQSGVAQFFLALTVIVLLAAISYVTERITGCITEYNRLVYGDQPSLEESPDEEKG